MSDPWAIAAVTHSFKALLETVSTDDASLNPVIVSVGPPDKARSGNPTHRQLNLFLYQITPNQGWRNADLPQRGGDGRLTTRPVLGVDLHYLLTVWGSANDELDGHHLLGHAMSAVHDRGMLARDFVRSVVTASGSPVSAAGLADQVELVKLTPEVLTDDELFRMWTVLGGAAYRLSVGYHASVALLQRKVARRSAPPVRQAAGLTVVPLRRPSLDHVEPQPVQPTGTLTLHGNALTADQVTVRFGSGLETPAPPLTTSNDEIELPVPTGLRAGPNTVQVLHAVEVRGTAETRKFGGSNVVVFVLAPTMSGLPASAARGSTVTVTLAPAVERRQQVTLYVGDVGIDRALPTGSAATTTSASFVLPTTLAASPAPGALVRVAVDGAETALTVDPATGQYSGPRIVVT